MGLGYGVIGVAAGVGGWVKLAAGDSYSSCIFDSTFTHFFTYTKRPFETLSYEAHIMITEHTFRQKHSLYIKLLHTFEKKSSDLVCTYSIRSCFPISLPSPLPLMPDV